MASGFATTNYRKTQVKSGSTSRPSSDHFLAEIDAQLNVEFKQPEFSDLSLSSEIVSAEKWENLTAEDLKEVIELGKTTYKESITNQDENKFRSQMCELWRRLLYKTNFRQGLFVKENIEIGDARYISHMNFKISMSKDSRPDLLLIYAFKSKDINYKIPIVIGELKKENKLSNKTHFLSACNQLLSYQVAVQRPLLQLSDTSGTLVRTLFGFVMDECEASIIELNADLWNSNPILDVKSINRFHVDSQNLEQSSQFFTILLVRVLKAMASNGAVEELAKPLFRFPSDLGTDLLDPCILRAKSGDIRKFVNDNIKNLNLRYPEEDLDFEWDELLNTEYLVLKVYGRLCSGGEDGHYVWALLNGARRKHRLVPVTSLYKAHFTFRYSDAFPFSISRFIRGVVCSKQSEIRKRWNQKAGTMPMRFFEDVYRVAFDALDLGYFHWDIRPANIMFDDENKCFVIIDWESVVSVSSAAVSQNWNSKFQANAEYLDNLKQYKKIDSKLAPAIYLFYLLCECLEYIGGPTKNDDWFNHVIVEPLKSIDIITFKTTFDNAMREFLGPFVSKELLPQFIVPEKSSVEMYCEFTLPKNAKLHNPRVIWRHRGVQIEAKDISVTVSTNEVFVVPCRLKLCNVLPSQAGKYYCLLEGTTSKSLLTTTSLRVTPVNKSAVEGPAGEGYQSSRTDADSS